MTGRAERLDALVWAARPHRTLWRDALSRLLANRLALFGLIMVCIFTIMAIFAPILAPYPYDKADFSAVSQYPTWTGKYPLGTDLVGRDMLSRLIWGAQVSMLVGLGA
jgi:ABC-type dipeptide/oligopeptide/nickel transport system permease subunit